MNSNYRKFATFASIGLLNTAVDAGIYTTLRKLGVKLIVANIISTSSALVLSYALNNKYTFQQKRMSRRTFSYFIGITLIGSWVLQPIIILIAERVLRLNLVPTIIKSVSTILSKLLATPFTLLWNYLWYEKVVFKRSHMPLATQSTLAD